MVLSLCLALGAAQKAYADENSCGDQQMVCGEEERCCEHVTATFFQSGASAPAYVEGRCIPKEQRCSAFWCGNRQCKSGLFGTPSVCCVNQTTGGAQEYQCAMSELSCPGNTQQLTIRTSSIQHPLQGS